MQLNPILVREVRARWRGRAFLLLFGYVALLATSMAWLYGHNFQNGSGLPDPLARMARLGHEMFLGLTWVQTLGWMLLGPALTATVIAGAREQGLLEALQLSPLSPWRICGGKLLGALSFASLMLLATLPILAICFLMGGVSPGEFLLAGLLQAVTTVTCAAIGLACSAWTRRANTALALTFGVLLTWFGASLLAFNETRWSSLSGSATGLDLAWYAVVFVFGRTNPVLASYHLVEPHSSGTVPALPTGENLPPWAICVLFQGALLPVVLWRAARGTGTTLGTPYWAEPRRHARARGQRRAAPGAPGVTAARLGGLVDGAAPGTPPASRWELPLARWLGFSNPVLQREARARFRLRRLSPMVVTALCLVVCCLLFWYLKAMWLVAQGEYRADTWWTVTFTGLAALILVTAASGASAFSREREAGTWEALSLSLATPLEIINGKLFATLLGCLAYSAPLWPLLLLCLGQSDEVYPDRAISIAQAAATVLLLGATSYATLAWAMLVSWRCRRTSVALTWTLGSILLTLVFLPVLCLTTANGSSRDMENFLSLWHPFFALARVVETRHDDSSTPVPWLCAMLLYLVGLMLLKVLHESMASLGRVADEGGW